MLYVSFFACQIITSFCGIVSGESINWDYNNNSVILILRSYFISALYTVSIHRSSKAPKSDRLKSKTNMETAQKW